MFLLPSTTMISGALFLVQLLRLAVPASAVIIIPSTVQPLAYSSSSFKLVSSTQEYFNYSAPGELFNQSDIVLSSHDNITAADNIRATSDSFVRGAIDAWAQHQHLVIRPDEVWFTVLVQVNFYMKKHAEDIRSLFVDFEGQQEIYVADFTWDLILKQFKDEIQARVKTKWLLDWILPGFSTTTESDNMTANILMMGLMQTYFTYTGEIICGIPSITLLGEQNDWERLLTKLDHLADFGAEPAAYAKRLRPIFTRFVQSFKTPDSKAIRTFFNQIVHAEPNLVCGGPPYSLSGWIMGFFFWNEQGEPYGQTGFRPNSLIIDGFKFPTLGIDTLPLGYAKAPFTMKNWNGVEDYPGWVLAGNLGKRIAKGAPTGFQDAMKRANLSHIKPEDPQSMLQPLSGWALYGPIPHNTTTKPLKKAPEYSALTEVIRKVYTDKSCNYTYTPLQSQGGYMIRF